ncbi:MAG: hypothetical protein JXR96_21855 [Deltaproteobacteria bacterium]|nr:hypothetical protein [Deltaproteobacteria bacterium]
MTRIWIYLWAPALHAMMGIAGCGDPSPECSADSDCAAMGASWYCEQATGTCACRSECGGRCCGEDGCGGACPDACSDGMVCDPATCLCGDCALGELRCDGDAVQICAAGGWTEVLDCAASGQLCRQGGCHGGACTRREDCAGPVCLVCREGWCADPPEICQGDCDCCAGMHCNFGTCVTDAAECRTDEDCTDPGSSVCRGGVCTKEGQPECERDVDCLIEGEVCVDGHCVP